MARRKASSVARWMAAGVGRGRGEIGKADIIGIEIGEREVVRGIEGEIVTEMETEGKRMEAEGRGRSMMRLKRKFGESRNNSYTC